MTDKITENQIREYVSSFISKSALDIAVAELYWVLNEQESVEVSRQNIIDFCKRNGAI